jgi:uncharacterized protein (DUF362 family)
MSDEQVNRRDFLKLSGKAAFFSTIVGGSGFLLAHNEYKPFNPPAKNMTGKRNITANSAYPDLVSVKSADHKKALLEAIAISGGIARFISKGDIVTIKPNIGWDRTPEQAANTNPILVAAMAELCFEAGAKKVVVTDVSCNEPRRCFQRSGINTALEGSKVEIVLPQDQGFIDIDLKGEALGVWPVLRPFLECDKLINIPIVKHHSLSSVTIGMKNWFGVLGGARNRLHQNIDTSIADLADFFRPTLVIVDATRVLMRNGPVGGNLADVEIHDTVIVGTDQVAADSFGCKFLGVNPSDIGFIIAAQKRGLGKSAGYSIIEKDLS